MPEFSHLFPTKESEDSEWAEPIWQQGCRAVRGSEEVTAKGRRRHLYPEPTLVAQKSTWSLWSSALFSLQANLALQKAPSTPGWSEHPRQTADLLNCIQSKNTSTH